MNGGSHWAVVLAAGEGTRLAALTRDPEVAERFEFTEGPIWLRDKNALLFSDPNHNTISEHSEDGHLTVFRDHSGHHNADVAGYLQRESEGLTLDRQGRLTIDEQGRHRVSRLERDGTVTVLTDRYEAKRLHSPNDLVYRSDGTLYFTFPPFGRAKFFDDPRKELPFSGVFSWKDRQLRLLSRKLKGPNGIVFTPDEKYLYVDNWDIKTDVQDHPVRPHGALSH